MQINSRTDNQVQGQVVMRVLFIVIAMSPLAAVATDTMASSSDLEAQNPAPAHYVIPFTKNCSLLGHRGYSTLDAITPQKDGAYIRIVGRPDAMFNAKGMKAQLAHDRANNIRDFLTRHGVPSNRIIIEVDNTPNPQPNGILYPSDIYISDATPALAAASNEQSFMTPVSTAAQDAQLPSAALQQDNVNATPPATPVATESFDIAQPDAAIPLPAGSTSPNPQAAAVVPASAPPTSETPPVPISAPEDTWLLDKALTLRDNLDAWSKHMDWNQVTWKATTNYQVTADYTLKGDFAAVLRQIADNTDLNICVFKNDKVIKVTDPKTSCKD